MPFAVEPCSDADIERVFEIISDTFRHTQPVVDALFPKHDTPDGRITGRDRLLEQKHNDPSVRFIKVTDSDTGQMVGQANWLVWQNTASPESLNGDFWESEDEKEFARQLWDQYIVPRSRAIEAADGKILILDMLAVDPKSQGKGVGSMLVNWGAELADQMGLDAVVESSKQGVKVYEKYGFRAVEKMQFDYPEKFASRTKPDLVFMRRNAKQRKQ